MGLRAVDDLPYAGADVRSVQRAVSVGFIRQSGALAVVEGMEPRLNTPARAAQILGDAEYADSPLAAQWHDTVVCVRLTPEPRPERFDTIAAALDRFLPGCRHVWGKPDHPQHRAWQVRSESPFDPDLEPVAASLQDLAGIQVLGGPVTRGIHSPLPGGPEELVWADLQAARGNPAVIDEASLWRGLRTAAAVALLAGRTTPKTLARTAEALAGLLWRARAVADTLPDPSAAFALTAGQARDAVAGLVDMVAPETCEGDDALGAFDRAWERKGRDAPELDVSDDAYALLTDGPDIAAMEEFTRRFAIWQGPGVIVDLDGIEAGERKPWMTHRQFQTSYAHRTVTVGGKRYSLAALFPALATATRVIGTTFEPSLDRRIVDDRVNFWTGFGVQPARPGITKGAVEPFLEYMREIVANRDEDCYRWAMAWCADILRNPVDKCGTALVLVGPPGAGKSILGHSILGPIVGRNNYLALNSADGLLRRYNGDLSSRLLIQCDEAAMHKNQAPKIKALVTDPWITVERKSIDPEMQPHCARLLFTSNDLERAVSLSDGKDDRRFMVLEVSALRRNDLAYWDQFTSWLARPQTLPAIARYFHDLRYDRKFIRRPLDTEARRRIQQAHWEPIDEWLATMLVRDHVLSVEHHLHPWDAFTWRKPKANRSYVPSRVNRDDWPTHCTRTAMMTDFRAFAGKGVEPQNEISMAGALAKRAVLDQGKRIRMDVKVWRNGKDEFLKASIYPAPNKERIAMYLAHRYGWSPDQ